MNESEAQRLLDACASTLFPYRATATRKRHRGDFEAAAARVVDDWQRVLEASHDRLKKTQLNLVARCMAEAFPERFKAPPRKKYRRLTIEEKDRLFEERAREIAAARDRRAKRAGEKRRRTEEIRREQEEARMRKKEETELARLCEAEQLRREREAELARERKLRDPAEKKRKKFEERIQNPLAGTKEHHTLWFNLAHGLPPEVVRQIVDAVPADGDDAAWAEVAEEVACLLVTWPSLADQVRLAYLSTLLRRKYAERADVLPDALKDQLDEVLPVTSNTYRQELLQTVGLLLELNARIARELSEAKKNMEKAGFFAGAGDK